MSGFGGFGSPPPGNAAFGSGVRNNSNSNSNPNPFIFGGQMPTPPPVSGSATTFGTSPNVVPGGQQAGFPAPPTVPTSTAFGGSYSTFGNPQAGPISTTTMFGSSPVMNPFGTANNNSSTNGLFGQPPAMSTGTGFSFGASSGLAGSPTPPAPGTGAAAPPAFGSPFGSGTTAFGTQHGGGGPAFPTTSTPSSSLLANNPFGAAHQSIGGGMSFGVSSTVAVGTGNTMMDSSGGGSDTDMMASSTSPTPFGPVGTFSTSFGVSQQHQNSGGMGSATPFGGGGGGPLWSNQNIGPDPFKDNETMSDDAKPPASNLPFGTPAVTTTAASASWPPPAHGSLSPVPEADDNMKDSLGVASPAPTAASSSEQAETEEERLSRLKAKIEEKKRLLDEQRRRKERFASSRSPSPVPNAHTASSSSSSVLISSMASHPRKGLENAVSLVGICQTMCPQEELDRRQNEKDIQLLEIPKPSILHPDDWTLKDTAVKRFRRSAADYKLDVPEWVRPPDILERVCGYLEEWVMERDRQGPDPRFTQGTGAPSVPPPLDVYQFIWDRTRMVRKDYILQNYVAGGSSGKCDARAVRCHERIARWHAMCEHQLSHIPDFVKMQSQQNIQELGQTMKTLNQYYDDSLGRSVVEVASSTDGSELPTDFSKRNHGCHSDIVHGPAPVDYDGTELKNGRHGVESRLVGGADAVVSLHRGTAEPEMRALYVLLTIDNDGGMEVLKYAAQLFQARPQVYHSKPFQLALTIYKAKKEDNYVRFFALLRSTATPYLFGCIMFKYVEAMRRTAFRIMSRTYGGKNRENEYIYDAYPLKTLAKLLCFEDLEEARAACQHYGIVVKPTKVRSSTGQRVEEIIFWRQGTFKEPKDRDKGTVIPLTPCKMKKIIEGKLDGATRLAVCRGQVSGAGAYLSESQLSAGGRSGQPKQSDEEVARQERERAEVLHALKEKEEQRLEAEAKKNREREEAKRQAEFLKRQEEERKRLEEIEKKRIENERKQRLAEEEQAKREKERVRLERERVEKEQQLKKIKMQREAERRKAEEAEQKRLLELKRREALRREEERKRQEALDEQRRMEEERRLMEESKRKQQEALEAAMRRQREEYRQLEVLKKEEEERKRKAVEELRESEEWRRRIDRARQKLILRRWQRKIPVRVQAVQRTMESLRHMVSTQEVPLLKYAGPPSRQKPSPLQDLDGSTDLRGCLERLPRSAATESMSVAALLAKSFGTSLRANRKKTLLFSIAVLLPAPASMDDGLCDLILSWMHSRLGFAQVTFAQSRSVEVRVVFVDEAVGEAGCDAAILVVPPPWSDSKLRDMQRNELDSLNCGISGDVPRVVLLLSETGEVDEERDDALAGILSGSFDGVQVMSNTEVSGEALDHTLWSCCRYIVDALTVDIPQAVEKVPLGRLVLMCTNQIIWGESSLASSTDIIEQVKNGLIYMLEEVEILGRSIVEEIAWPAVEFLSEGRHVVDYFGKGDNLPGDWCTRSISATNRSKLLLSFEGSLGDILDGMLAGAPNDVVEECWTFRDRRLWRRCLQRALLWKFGPIDDKDLGFGYLYMSKRSIGRVVEQAVNRVRMDFEAKFATITNNNNTCETYEDEDSVMERIDSPPPDVIGSPAVATGIRVVEDVAEERSWNEEVTTEEMSERGLGKSADPSNISVVVAQFREDKMVEQNPKRRRIISHFTSEREESQSFTRRLKELAQQDAT